MTKDALACPLRGARSTARSTIGRRPPTTATGVRGLPFFPLLMLVLLLALAVPGAAQETWTATSTTNAPTAGGSGVWTGSKMIVAGSAGGVYDPATDSWTATSTTNAPTGGGSVVWTGSKMIVWGGQVWWDEIPSLMPIFINTGRVYDPATDSWTATSATNAPTGRDWHSVVWTGSRMIVWGGEGSLYSVTNTGGVYDPATDAWTATSTTNAPSARAFHTAVWTGSKMIVWGGGGDTGGVYDPATDTWVPTSTKNAPSARRLHTAVWTGTKMIVWGGEVYSGSYVPSNTGGVYDPATGTWTATSTTNAPSGRERHTAVWTGTKMIVWGGYGGSSEVDTGGVYDPATDSWTATSTTNAPSARDDHTAVWTGSKMIVWGGCCGTPQTGGVYSNPAVLPPPAPPADFYTVTPCRLVDTRNTASATGGPALVGGAVRSFPVTGGVCGIPATAVAVSVNLTVVQPAAQGYLALYPGDAAGPPLVSNINFSAGVTRANNAIVLLATNGGTVNVKNGLAGAVHFVLDVNGYFR